jgi:hypothetical protein
MLEEAASIFEAIGSADGKDFRGVVQQLRKQIGQ